MWTFIKGDSEWTINSQKVSVNTSLIGVQACMDGELDWIFHSWTMNQCEHFLLGESEKTLRSSK